MKRILSIILIALASIILVVPARAARTQAMREDFSTIKTLNNSTPGSFTGFSNGSMTTWRVGPKSPGDAQADGSHADVPSSGAVDAYYDMTQTAGLKTGFCIEFYYWTGEFNQSGFAGIAQGGTLGTGPWGNENWGIYRRPDGTYLFRFPVNGDSTTTIPQWQWVRMYIYAFKVSGTNWTYHMGYQLVGGAEVDVWSGTNVNLSLSSFDVCGIRNDTSGVKFSYALGAFTVTKVDGTADFGACNDITAPTDTGHTSYWVDATSPAGFGTQASPYTKTQIANGLAGSGILGNDSGNGTAGYGEHLICASTTYQAPTLIATGRQRGLWIDGNGATLNFLKTVSGTWTQPDAGAAPNVWSIADSELTPLTSYVPVVFENGNGQTSVAGANFAAVKATLNTTAGSHWSDGTTLYVHPYANTNPNTDGKTYQRSTATAQECGVQFGGQDQKISAFALIDGTVYYDRTNLQNVGGIAVSDLGGTGARSGGLVQNVNCTRWGKHAFNFTASTSSGKTVTSCTAERGWPYGTGSQSAMVDYSDSLTQTATWNYITARQTNNAYAVGANSAGLGQNSASGTPYLSHGTSGIFSVITFNHCQFGGGVITVNPSLDLSVVFNACDSFVLSGYGGAVTVTGGASRSGGSGLGLGL